MNSSGAKKQQTKDFELIKSKSDNTNAVFRRKIKNNVTKKNKRSTKVSVEAYPTATIHYFSKEDFEALKAIEELLIIEYKNKFLYTRRTSRSLKTALKEFFEL